MLEVVGFCVSGVKVIVVFDEWMVDSDVFIVVSYYVVIYICYFNFFFVFLLVLIYCKMEGELDLLRIFCVLYV